VCRFGDIEVCRLLSRWFFGLSGRPPAESLFGRRRRAIVAQRVRLRAAASEFRPNEEAARRCRVARQPVIDWRPGAAVRIDTPPIFDQRIPGAGNER
jgi:hypothetical protein